MANPQRKNLRLPDYDYSAPGAYFVTICTQNRQCILSNITVGAGALDGPTLALTRTGEVVEKFILSTDRIAGLTVDRFVIMPNHVHMILTVASGGGPSRAPAPTNAIIPHAIGTLKRFVNKELGESIWQRGYYEHVIRSEKDYLEIRTYIDQNPAKWAEDPYYETKTT